MNFNLVRVGDVVSFQNGYAFKSKDFTQNGFFKIIKIKELKNGKIKFFSDSARININDENILNKYKVENGDILFALTGDPISKNNPLSWVGRISIYKNKDIALLNQRVCRAIFSNKIDSKYFYYYFRVFENFFSLASKATGSASQANISTKTIEESFIQLPPLETQKKIASILSALDDKIELNNKINENLEMQAQAIFKSWFVDFEPFGGVMPEDMREIPLNELCEIVTKGTTPTTIGKHFSNKGINFLKAESILQNHSFDRNKFAHIDNDTHTVLKRSIIKEGDIVFTIAGTLGRFALVDNTIIPANTNQAVAIIRANNNVVSSEYLYSFFIGNWHNEYYTKRVQQAVQANLSLTTIKSLPIFVLSNEDMMRYNGLVTPIFKAMKANEYENFRLSALRDTLLPKLMNGEIDVDDVQVKE